jgi:hypothetical protein
MIINHVWPGLLIIIAVAAFAAYILTTIHYIINGNDLIIRSGFIVNTTIKIDTIKKIKETHNPLSSPAASLDRLAIHYGKSGFIMVSPKNKMDFIKDLTAINTKIEVVK